MFAKALRNPFLLFGGLFFVALFSFGLCFLAHQEYALNYLFFFALLLFLILGFFLLDRFGKDHKAKSHKWGFLTNLSARLADKKSRNRLIFLSLSLLLCLLFFARYYFYRGYFEYTDSYGVSGSFYYYDIFHLESQLVNLRLSPYLLNRYEAVLGTLSNDLWGAMVILSLVSAFYLEDSSLAIRRYIGAPSCLLLTLAFPLVLKGVVGQDCLSYRSVLLGLELAILDFYFLSSFLEEGKFAISKKEVGKLLRFLLPLLLTMASSYSPSLLFGRTITLGNYNLTNPHDPENISHRLYIYLSFLLPALYFAVLYPLSVKERRAALLQISLGSLLGYVSIYRADIWNSVATWPLHLCNTAMYTMPITLLFMSYGLYYFTFFINVLGAFFALTMPNFSETLAPFHPEIMAFYINHLHAFFMPVLIVLLGVYKRPKIKYYLYSQIGFFAYFALVMGVNTVLTAKGINSDFFFINSDFIADKLGEGAKRLFKATITWESNGLTYTLHLAYDIVYYLAYVLLALAMWFLYELLFRLVDELIAIKEAKKRRISRHEAYLKLKQGGLNMSGENSLVITHLWKKYRGNENFAVEDFSLSLEGGKIYGFLGKNGAGKSTIIKSIVGIHGFDEGYISVCGHDVVEEPLEAKREIGFVPDNYALYENLTGRQYIGYIADLYRVSKAEKEEIEKNLVERLELGWRYDKPMKSYSHGMKQKITIIAALIHKPKIWILDEPMTGLDPNSIYQIKECMKEHAAKGNIVFFSSHIIDVVKNLCDEAIIIKRGNLVKRIDLDKEPWQRESLEETFLTLTSDTTEEADLLLAEERKQKGAA